MGVFDEETPAGGPRRGFREFKDVKGISEWILEVSDRILGGKSDRIFGGLT